MVGITPGRNPSYSEQRSLEYDTVSDVNATFLGAIIERAQFCIQFSECDFDIQQPKYCQSWKTATTSHPTHAAAVQWVVVLVVLPLSALRGFDLTCLAA